MFYKKAVITLEDFPISELTVIQNYDDFYCATCGVVDYEEEGEPLLKFNIKGIETEYDTLENSILLVEQLILEYEKEHKQTFNETAKDYLSGYVDYVLENATIKEY